MLKIEKKGYFVRGNKYLYGVIVLLLIFFLASVVEATPINSGDLPPDATIIDFDDLASGTVVTTQYLPDGVTFSGGVVTFLAPGQVLSIDSEIIATFSENVNIVGVDFSSNSLLTLEVYDAFNTLIESVTATSLSGFFGLSTPNKMISFVKIHDSGFGFTIDNFTFADPIPVPEPSTLLLLGSSLIGAGLLGWRRKRK